ncbi:unnamed protein product [Protopolystoma xenopodis]|uniref:Uncharacterized protein n=1 Tax=Protopolystoma xenopodis TaxID=117903 RepID=A0A448WTL9_9PLAT|nr:unnamed protein product [Protopolystoma xenopodis]
MHERLVFDGDFVTDACSPKADELPRFWEDGGDLSFLWRTETIPDPNSSKDADCKESLETIRRLVSEEDSYEDPAIIDVSKRANYFPFNASSNHQVPAFTYAPEAVFDSSKDIWGCHKGQNFEEISLNMCNQTFSSRHETQDSSPPIESSNGSDLLKKFLIQLKLGSAKTLPTPTSNISTSSMKESLERSNHRFIPHEFKTRDTISLNKSLNGVTSHRMDIPFSQPEFIPYTIKVHLWIIYDQISRSDHSSFSLHSRSFDTQSTTSKNLPQNPPCSNNQMQIKQRTSTFDSIGYKAQTGDLGQNFEEFESEEFDFDPERDCWMTDNERNWVLKVQLSPLIAVNPYMQDYYFAVQWLRNLSTRRNQLLSMGQYPRDLQSPIFQLPSPLSIESLLEPNHPHHLAIRHRLAISGYLNSDTSSHLPLESLRSSTTGSEVDKNSLGKPTKSSVHTPRQVAELSVANALSELHAEQVSNLPNRPVSNHMVNEGK